jgi:phosphoglycerate dehydrogenase-like enzyme
MTGSLLLLEYEKPADLALYRQALGKIAPDIEIVAAASEEAALAAAGGAEIVMGKAQTVTPRLFAALDRLRWIQALTTGTDPIEALALPAPVMVTSGRGIHGPQMSELAILMMLALLRDLPSMLRNQAERRWQRWPQRLLAGRTALLVGLGQIAEAVAARCRAFDMQVIGVSDGRGKVDGFAAVYPRARLAEAAARADFVIVIVPYGADTHHLVGEAVLRAMRPDAFLLNIARGRVVDEAALLRALEQGWIAGAGLDVFEREPLPPEDPLWQAPNLLITPHIGGMSDRYAEQVLPILQQNLLAYLAGQFDAMVNVVRPGGFGR